jgi:thioesterase-3
MDATPAAPHEITLTVRGYHLDLYGHVNNARYLEFLEEARWAWFESRADLSTLLGAATSMVMVRLEIDYRYPAGIGEQLTIASTLGEVRNRSAVIHQEIRLTGSGRPVADANITVVYVDRASGRAVPIDGPLREFLDVLA